MSTATFDFEALFDNDYLYFYEPNLTIERTEREVNLIWHLLNLKAGMDVLDLACGHGRIANQLQARGCQVTGLDATDFFLAKARHDAEEQGVAVEYVKGDMRSLPWEEYFDHILIWFTAFGYFEDNENRQVLTEACHALKPGGKLIIDTMNLNRLLKTFLPASITERNDNLMLDQSHYDVLNGRICTERTIIRDGKIRRMKFFVRLFTYPELRDWLLQAGFSQVEGYGKEGEPLALDSRRMVAVATK
ncbi:MAG: class I SAM-dependent methyltransferase [Chroococcidiopsidaceae cyanobacterium CP_BM_ER_R8_30]|nr:class I SAM-dependent methyltransferase [Chroococcidiopsidaceae cyanobacterium CP_BM_ER_R8_30]